MPRKVSIAALVLLAIVGVSLAGGYYVVQRRSEAVCGFCQRHISPKAAVVAEVGGSRRHVCCAHCAFTEGLQEKKPVRLISVTDYNSGKKLKPEEAWYADGSRVVACEHDMTHMDEAKHATHVAFDRCSPGTFAFARRDEADTFVAQNGGIIRRLTEMTGEVQSK